MQKWILALGFACSSMLLHATNPIEPKLSLQRNNISVWTYQTQDNPVIQYKAETTFNVPIERAVGLILDVEHAKQWMPYVGESKILAQDQKNAEYIIYLVLDFPFPLKDRDVVVKSKLSKQANGNIVIKNQVLNQYYPTQKNRIRLTKYEGDWIFQKMSDQKVKVTTTGYADPGGSIPLSFVNMFVEQQPYQMLMKMKQELAKPATKINALPQALQ